MCSNTERAVVCYSEQFNSLCGLLAQNQKRNETKVIAGRVLDQLQSYNFNHFEIHFFKLINGALQCVCMI